MFKICISGGSCGGKSTVLDLVKKNFPTNRTFEVPETASEVMRMGLNRNVISNTELERIMFELQIHKEDCVNAVARRFDDSVVNYDRGLLELLAYIDRPSFDSWFKDYGLIFDDILKRYDLIIHMVSAAVGTDCYNLKNPYRIEHDLAQAVLSEKLTLEANSLHPNVVVVDNSTGFDEKVERVMEVIRRFISCRELPLGTV